MYRVLSVFTVFILLSCASSRAINSSSSKKLGKSYGPVKVDTSLALNVEELLIQFQDQKDKLEFTFKAPISQVCLKAGCWVKIDKGNGESFMVRFKDHFTIPVDTEIGTEAYIHGYAYWDTVSVEMLKHFAEDAGKSPEEISKINNPEFLMSFEADGIVLVKN
jgi:hypothetical protein